MSEVAVPTAESPPPDLEFERDLFLLRQKRQSGARRYDVRDERGQMLLSVERPPRVRGNLIATLGAVVGAVVVGAFFSSVGDSLVSETAHLVFAILGVFVGVATYVVVRTQLLERRQVAVRRLGAGGRIEVQVEQVDKLALASSSFMVKDGAGRLLATFRRNHFLDLVRTRWELYSPNGTHTATVAESSVWRAIVGRLLGAAMAKLRTNYVIAEAARGRKLGEIRRHPTMLDRYVLDLTADPGRGFDRRVALAIGVMIEGDE